MKTNWIFDNSLSSILSSLVAKHDNNVLTLLHIEASLS